MSETKSGIRLAVAPDFAALNLGCLLPQFELQFENVCVLRTLAEKVGIIEAFSQFPRPASKQSAKENSRQIKGMAPVSEIS